MQHFTKLSCISALMIAASPATAAVTWLTARLDGAQAGTASPGVGTGRMSYDDVTRRLTWSISWSGLQGTASAMHFHGPAAPGANAGVQVGIGVASNPISGSSIISAAQATNLLAGLYYLNIHTSTAGGGEIRGQVLRALTNYWPLEEGTGTTSANSVPGGMEATLKGGSTWSVDPQRGKVVAFDGAAGTHATAGMIGPIAPEDDFTWSFWLKPATTQAVNNDVIFGNRLPNEGWFKFTPNAFEFRDLPASFNTNLNYPNFTTGVWSHSAVVKRGGLFTYYRDGVASINGVANGTLPADTPVYFGGDPAAGEEWEGSLDEPALFRAPLPSETIAKLADGSLKPDTAPLLITAPVLATVLSDNFSTNLANWTVSNRGLENNAAAGYDAPVITAGAVVLGGTTTSQYWFGSSLESVKTFDTRQPAEVTVKRVALTGSGTAYRSSVWIHGGDSHYLHLSQNVGEGGWSYNARAASGIGNLNPTGGGNNLVLLDPIDGDQEVHTITLRLIPAGGAGKVNIEMFVDGILAAVHGFTTFPNGFRLILTGQGRATGDMVSASFDDVVIKGTVLLNLPPVWTSATYSDPTATAGVLHSPPRPGGLATDPEGGILTFSKVSGPAWVTVQSNNGAFSGTPGAGDTGIATVVIRATDPAGNTTDATWTLRVQPAGTGPLVLTGWWPLNDGQGTRVRNLGTGAADGVLANELTGGLGPNGESWVTDPDYGMVASFAGEGAGSSWIGTGTAEEPWMIPADLLNTGKFTMSCRVKVERTGNNDIVIGNRYKADGTDFAPLQFQKLTTSNYEWYNNGGQFIDIANLPQSVWAHHTVIKDGGAIFYYFDGKLTGMRNVTHQLLDMPFYIGGQGTEAGGAIEPCRGYISDVRFYSSALTDSQVATLAANRNLPAPTTATFKVTNITRTAQGNVSLSWENLPGSKYSVWASTTMISGWVKLAENLTVTQYNVAPGGNPNTATEPRVFFQIRAGQ